MAPYATFPYYKANFFGSRITDPAMFNRLALRASAYLDKVTYGRVAAHSDEDAVKNACCAVVEEMQKTEDGGELISQRVGSWTRTYARGSKPDADRYFDAAQLYLPCLVAAARWI